ncbi:unnamed protein product [Ilex paraguariensis]|uniref:Uncharacterized protein n=1 Tax=Ilex paraguariensis TaxID=185542 RepID=A0ABC8RQG9_9AQUA
MDQTLTAYCERQSQSHTLGNPVVFNEYRSSGGLQPSNSDGLSTQKLQWKQIVNNGDFPGARTRLVVSDGGGFGLGIFDGVGARGFR